MGVFGHELHQHGRVGRLSRRPRSWTGDCPSCGYPRAFCLKSNRHGVARAFCANGCTPDQLDGVLQRALGADWTPPPRLPKADVAAGRVAKQAAAASLFRSSTLLTTIDPAGLYLAGRGLATFTASPALRYRGDCHHQDGRRLPALVAEILDAAGQPIACHRTYLTRDGRKAGVNPNKMTLGPMWGGAVRLTTDGTVPTELVVGEGIESSASAGLLLDLPAWAALSAGNLGGGLVLPDAVRAVTIATDADKIGLREARTAARRWRAEGRRVRIALPDISGRDFNDLLQTHAGRSATVSRG